jgi:hypothetical protein
MKAQKRGMQICNRRNEESKRKVVEKRKKGEGRRKNRSIVIKDKTLTK